MLDILAVGINYFVCFLVNFSHRESLRNLVIALEAHSNKSYHLGFGKSVTRSNFAKANERRPYKIFEDFAYHLIKVARDKRSAKEIEIQGSFYAYDSTTIDLCLSIFWWAGFRKTKAGIKLHTLLDIRTQIPVFVHITPARVNDVNGLDWLIYEYGAYYVIDRGYFDAERLYKINQSDAYFVIRAKSNLKFRRIYSNKIDKSTGVKCDQIGKFTVFYTLKEYPEKLRRIKYYDHETDRTFVFLTNNMELSPQQIALLYKKRWQIENFFKWIKQHLKIKSFWGRSQNAVRIQIYSAIIAYCLVAIVEDELKIEQSTYEILQILSLSLLDKTPVNELFTNTDYKNIKEQYHNQLVISLF